VILAGGAYLFWPRGGGAPTGIGEQLTVVTADSTAAAAPRSGSVTIQEEQQAIVPETRDGGATETERKPEPAETKPEQKAQTAPPKVNESRAATSEAATAVPDKPRITPRPSGSWAVQIGAFQTEDNAKNLVSTMAEKGVTAQVRAAGTSSGAIVYRVWIGWFANRQEALDYGKQERRTIGESYPVHR